MRCSFFKTWFPSLLVSSSNFPIYFTLCQISFSPSSLQIYVSEQPCFLFQNSFPLSLCSLRFSHSFFVLLFPLSLVFTHIHTHSVFLLLCTTSMRTLCLSSLILTFCFGMEHSLANWFSGSQLSGSFPLSWPTRLPDPDTVGQIDRQGWSSQMSINIKWTLHSSSSPGHSNTLRPTHLEILTTFLYVSASKPLALLSPQPQFYPENILSDFPLSSLASLSSPLDLLITPLSLFISSLSLSPSFPLVNLCSCIPSLTPEAVPTSASAAYLYTSKISEKHVFPTFSPPYLFTLC